QVAEYNLSKVGMSFKDKPVPGSVYYNTLETRGADFDMARAGWCAAVFYPFDYINVIFDGRSIQARNNVNLSYLNSPKLNAAMDRAAALSGSARAAAYAIFFQAEDGIRDWSVTGVQTCALPI